MKKLIGLIIAAAIVYLFVNSVIIQNSPERIERALKEGVTELNRTLPHMIDTDTRLDSAVAGPGKRLTFNCTLVKYLSSQLDPHLFQQQAKPDMLKAAKNSWDAALIRKLDVELHYVIRDRSGGDIVTIVITPDEL